MKKLSILFGVMIITLFFVSSCKKEMLNSEENIVEENLETSNNVVLESSTDTISKANSLLKFKIMPIESDINGNPASKIYVSTDLALDFVASVIGKAVIIKNNEFNKMNIPADAVAACGSSWEGVGTYFYIIDAKSGYKIFKGSQNESDSEYKWEVFQQIN